jgi:Reverse transcriptase (RNA-dependent DNA polymerase)
MANMSLFQDKLPDSQKQAIVKPFLTKLGLDTVDLNSYRLVSNLSLMSKLIERVVANQLNEHSAANSLSRRFLSAYRRGHSTKTALLRDWSDALMTADGHKVTLFGLLDVSATFDCFDYLILLHRLQVAVGIGTAAHDWFQSFLSGRTQ